MVRPILLVIAVLGWTATADAGPGARPGGRGSAVRGVRTGEGSAIRRPRAGASRPVKPQRARRRNEVKRPRQGRAVDRMRRARAVRSRVPSRLRFRTAGRSRTVELVIFDLDGTLADTRADVMQHLDRGFRAIDLQLSRAELEDLVDGVPLEETFERAVADPQPGQLDTFIAAVIESQRTQSPKATLFPGMARVLRTLAREPGVKVGLATARSTESAERVLRALGIRQHFDLVTGSGQSRFAPKPAPDLLLHTARRLGVSAERAIMIGDTDHDVGAGRAAGMGTVGMNGIGLDRIAREKPDRKATDMRQVLTYLGTAD